MRSSRALKIECSRCKGGVLRERLASKDVSALLGLESVVLEQVPALVCNKCGYVSVGGEVLEAASEWMVAHILKGETLLPGEAKFLRKHLMETQEELAEHLGVTRPTVQRWESQEEPLDGTNDYALRAYVFLCLEERGVNPIGMGEVLQILARKHAPEKRHRGPYKISDLRTT